MNNRTTIYASDLYLLIDREFKLRRTSGCDVCYIQLPYRVDREDEAAANWEIVIPAACPHDCRQLIQDIAAEYGVRYFVPSPGARYPFPSAFRVDKYVVYRVEP